MSLTEPFNFSLLQTGNPAHGQMEISVSDCGRQQQQQQQALLPNRKGKKVNLYNIIH